MRFLYRSMLYDRSRTLLSVLAVAGAIVLVVVLEGFKVGLWKQMRTYPEQLPVQLIAMQSGVKNMTAARSVIPIGVQDVVRATPGVRNVHPLVGVPAMFARGDQKTPIYVIGYDEVGGPWRLKAGRNADGPGELVMDYSLARKHGLGVGEKTQLLGRDFQIVGLSAETSSMFNPYVFIGLEEALSLFSTVEMPQQSAGAGTPSFLLVEVEQGVRVSQVQKELEEAAPAIDVFTPAELAANDVAMAQGLMGPVMDLLVGVAYVVGILVIGLTLYTSVFERLREYGIMKAIGARNARLYRYVLAQAIAFAAAGAAVGFLASLGVAALIAWLAPQYVVVPWDSQVLIRSFVATTVMALIASGVPIRQVTGVDPALVFRQ